MAFRKSRRRNFKRKGGFKKSRRKNKGRRIEKYGSMRGGIRL